VQPPRGHARPGSPRERPRRRCSTRRPPHRNAPRCSPQPRRARSWRSFRAARFPRGPRSARRLRARRLSSTTAWLRAERRPARSSSRALPWGSRGELPAGRRSGSAPAADSVHSGACAPAAPSVACACLAGASGGSLAARSAKDSLASGARGAQARAGVARRSAVVSSVGPLRRLRFCSPTAAIPPRRPCLPQGRASRRCSSPKINDKQQPGPRARKRPRTASIESTSRATVRGRPRSPGHDSS
jgi:hypothetical protein